MALTIRHQVLAGISMLIFLTQVGCAARPVTVTPPEPGGRRTAVAEVERSECEAFARAEAATLRRPSAAAAGLKTLGAGVAAGVLAVASVGTCVMCALIAPVAILGAPFEVASIARENSRAREAAHAAALAQCRRPAILEAELGPDHPDVAGSLRELGLRYAALGQVDRADALHRRALQIRERALPDRHPDIAESLEAIAALRRQSGRVEEAETLEGRAKAIREDEEGQARATGRLPDFVRTLVGRGVQAAAAGNLATAEADYLRATAIHESEPGVVSEDLLRWLFSSRAELLREVGRAAEADEIDARAATIGARAVDADLSAHVPQ